MVKPGFAATQDKILDAKEKQEQNQQNLKSVRDRIASLEEKKGQSESYLKELNQQFTQLESSLETLQGQYDKKQEELNKIQEELDAAKAIEEQQYENMKIRIRYMYENGSQNYLNLFFQSDGIVDFLNRAENISRITKYDRDMLDSYTQTKELVQTKEQEVIEEQEAIQKLQQESEEKQKDIQELVQATYHQIKEYQEELSTETSSENTLLKQIEEQEASINSLLKQAKEEEAARLLAQQKAKEEEARKEEKKKEEQNNKKQNSSTSSNKDTTEKQEGEIDTSKGQYLGRFKLTGYCTCPICCGKWSGGGKTASGTTPTPGRTVAMGGVPFGTKLSINGVVYTVEDRGTAYGHVDILMGSHGEALQFGMKYADVYQVQ